MLLCVGDFFNSLDAEGSAGDDVDDLLAGRLEGAPFCDAWSDVVLIPSLLVPVECYIMQGEHPLPASVIEKFAKTGGELCKDVFLLSEHLHVSLSCRQLMLYSEVRNDQNTARTEDRLFGRHIRPALIRYV